MKCYICDKEIKVIDIRKEKDEYYQRMEIVFRCPYCTADVEDFLTFEFITHTFELVLKE